MEALRVQTVLVTGADRGLGLGLVGQLLKLPRPPKFIFATCRQPDGPGGQALKEMAETCSSLSAVVIIKVDVTDLESIKEAARKVGEHVAGCGLNLVINNATVTYDTRLDTESAQSMASTYATNTTGPMLVGQEFLPLLKRAAWRSWTISKSCSKAAIVNISSGYGSLSLVEGWGWKQIVSYRCSKAALNMLTHCQALGYRLWGVLCICINPGGVEIDLGGEQDASAVASRAKEILKVLARLSAKDNGAFLDWRGETVPW